METRYSLKVYQFIFAFFIVISGSQVCAEGFGLGSVTEGVSDAQSAKQAMDTTKQVTEMGQVAAATSDVNSGSLTDTLVNKLGVSSAQAQGGAGAIFTAAQGQLDAGQFASLEKAVPEMDTLLSAAPKQADSLGGMASGAASMLGDQGSSYGNLAGLASSFSALGLSPDMADQFVPVVVDYVRNQGGASVSNMLQSALLGQ